MKEKLSDNKYGLLFRALSEEDKVTVAFSGGTDSTFLLEVCVKAIGAGNVTAVTVLSSARHSREGERASEIARKLGIRHILLRTEELDIEQVRFNRADRCYHCKKHLYSVIRRTIKEEGAPWTLLDATTIDEAGGHRPGLKALRELGIRCPLAEADMTKEDVKSALEDLGLMSEIYPEESCLLTRFPHGEEITELKLRVVREAEEALFSLGFSLVRLRCHGDTARIELAAEEIPKAIRPDIRQQILKLLKPEFRHITLDIEGFRSGSMDVTGE
jgi:uncharacterized protein